MKWFGNHSSILLSAISSSKQIGPSGGRPKRRRCGQSYEGFINYLSDEEWTILLERNPSGAKLRILLETALGLGLRCPTEPCYKYITSVWMMLDLQESERRKLTPQSKNSLYQHVKKEFKSACRAYPDAAQHLERLPDRPAQLCAESPEMYHAHFKHARVPVEPKLDMRLLLELDASYSCRNGGATAAPSSMSVAASTVPTLQVPPAVQGMELQAVERVAGLFMEKLDTMQQRQERAQAKIQQPRTSQQGSQRPWQVNRVKTLGRRSKAGSRRHGGHLRCPCPGRCPTALM